MVREVHSLLGAGARRRRRVPGLDEQYCEPERDRGFPCVPIATSGGSVPAASCIACSANDRHLLALDPQCPSVGSPANCTN
jgi:hypothetical protein